MGEEDVEGGNIFFTGCNVHIRSGKGSTDAPTNGKGNLIIGYNKSAEGVSRGGSHNLIIGDQHEYTSFGGIVTGQRNRIPNIYSTVTGGYNNAATGYYSTVTGGAENEATGDYSSISGGGDNTASGYDSSVLGGKSNVAQGDEAVVTGGIKNKAIGELASVVGGKKKQSEEETLSGYWCLIVLSTCRIVVDSVRGRNFQWSLVPNRSLQLSCREFSKVNCQLIKCKNYAL